jgi:molecular chaperone GrpE
VADNKNNKPSDPKLEKAQRMVGELTEALQHERADSINLRRQHEMQLAGVRQLSTAKVIKELLPAIDNLERSLKHIPDDLKDNEYIKGVEATVKQFDKILSDLGVSKIKTIGEEFDPKIHEAVQLDDSSGGSREIISEELQSGYLLGDEVVRPAMVNVRLEG